MTDSVFICIKGNIEVCVPNNTCLLTHYVLREQEDWFEDEIGFIRKLIKPGMKIIDIGANYGVYTLTAAKLAGVNGKIWAFEPSSTTANFLAKSLAANNINNTELVQAGLSDKHGHSSLILNPNTEMCFISDNPDETEQKEAVDLYSLDSCMEKYAWHDIDFIKMDAEGHESKIIKGGVNLFSASSPLVMYEIKAGDKVNLDLLRDFKRIDYESYQLVPGLDMLIPFDSDHEIDGYLLNLFCCKNDCAAGLERQGLLARNIPAIYPDEAAGSHVLDYMRQFPYARHFHASWKNYDAGNINEEQAIYRTALGNFILSRNDAISAGIRYSMLVNSFDLLNSLADRGMSASQLISLVRISSDLGRRKQAVGLLQKLIAMINNKQKMDLSEPFLPLSHTLESSQSGGNNGNWLLSGILETFEKLRAYSSYYTGPQSLEILEMIKGLGHQIPEMERRRQLLMICSGKQKNPHCNPLLSEKYENNLNPEYWCGDG